MKRQGTNLSKRVKRAKASAAFAKIMSKNKQGAVTKVVVPGHEGKQYQIIIRRASVLSTECRLDTAGGYQACPGNSNGHVCYHSIAALEVAARESKVALSWCQNEREAIRLENLGGQSFPVTSWQGKGRLWAVVAR